MVKRLTLIIRWHPAGVAGLKVPRKRQGFGGRMQAKQVRIRFGWVVVMLLFAGSCKPGSLTAISHRNQRGRSRTHNHSWLAFDAGASGRIPQHASPAPSKPRLDLRRTNVLTSWPRALLISPRVRSYPAQGVTEGGWIGFDPQTAQAGNVGPFRLRWLPPEGNYASSGDSRT